MQLVRSYRENGRTKHEVLLNLGRLDMLENNPSIQRLALRLVELSKAKQKQTLDLSNASEAEILNWGYLVYQKIWKEFGLHEFLTSLTAGTKVQFSLNDACFLMAIQHLLDPMSKLGTFNNQQRYVNMPKVDLNHLYRSLDILCENKERLEENLIVIYSEKRARKDRADRERLIEKAKTLLADKSKIKSSNKRGGKRFLKEIGAESDWVLDEEAIKRDEQFDGYYGIQTNEKNLSAEEVLDAYHNFFLLARTLELRLQDAGIKASPEKIRDAINSLNFAKVEIDGRAYYIKTKGADLSTKILRLLRMKQPNNVIVADDFQEQAM